MALAVGLVAAASLVAGCSEGPQQVQWELRFATSNLEERSQIIDVRILPGSCDGELLVYHVELVKGDNRSVPPPPPRLDPGRYALSARASDAECSVVAEGCRTITLPQGSGDSIEVMLEEVAPTALCASSSCVVGRCVADPTAFADGGPPPPGLDAGSPPVPNSRDAGPGVPYREDAGPQVVTPDAGPMCSPPETICDGACVDTATDRHHCGGCDQRCVLDHADAECAVGACAVERCFAGFEDVDGVADNGCEVLVGDACDAAFSASRGYARCAEHEATFPDGSCAFAARTGGRSCAALCGSFGATCVAAMDNEVTVSECTDTGILDDCDTPRETEICVCALP